MLVLSRQKNQRINFPGLDVAVEILEVKGSKVRVGVEAPMEVRILRGELDEHGDSTAVAPHVIRLPQSLRHDLRNALHELSLMLHVYRKRDEKSGNQPVGQAIDAEQMFEAIVSRLKSLSQHGALSKSGMIVTGGSSEGQGLGEALVVDDDDNERELLAGVLRMCDYRVNSAANGVDALQYLESNEPPRVILLDMHMPKCDGRAFLRKIRQHGAWDPIDVFVVSGSTPEEHGLSQADGYTHWFSKPLDPRQVVEKLAQIETRTPSVA